MCPKSVCKAMLLAASLLLPFSSQAANDSEIVVTASRMPESVDASRAAVTVFTRAEIERSQPQDMLQLLQTVPGIDISRTGGPGSSISLFMRGTNSNHTLILIDGMRAGSASSGAFAWETLLPSQIERIEIVRGPRAALYGSDAIGGVIQIFTRRPESLTARAEVGTHGTRSASVGMTAGDSVRFHLFAEHSESDGFSATNTNIDATSFCPPFCSFDPDDDGFENDSVSVSVETELSPNTRLAAKAWVTNSENDFDDGAGNTAITKNDNQVLSLRFEQMINDLWSHSFAVGRALDDQRNETTNPFSSSSRIETTRHSFDWQNDVALSDNGFLVTGVNYYRDDVSNDNTTTQINVFDRDIDNRALFASYQHQFERQDLLVSMRYDDHSEFGDKTTGQIAWGYSTGASTRVIASYGTAFRAPGLNELFHPGFGGFFAGNPSLNPETSRSWELGFRALPTTNERIEVTVFRNEIDDLIAYEGTNFQAINVSRATTRGVEFGYQRNTRQWITALTLTLQRARNENSDTPLLRRPNRKMFFALTRRLGSENEVGGEILLNSKREDVDSITLPGFGVANLFARYALDKQWAIELRVDNLFDKEYQLVNGYNTPERTLVVALRYGSGYR